MKVFFDTNVYIAESLLGAAAQQMIEATRRARWPMYATGYLVDEVGHVLSDDLGFSRRLAKLAQRRILRRCTLVEPSSADTVPDDIKDTPILQGAVTCGADYLVTNDRHLLALDPFKGLRIISMQAYYHLLVERGMIQDTPT